MDTGAIRTYLDSIRDRLVEWRRDFHRNPELLYDLPRTSKAVAERLAGWGLEVETGVGRHFGRGIVATLTGGRPGKTVLLRADMDALPVREERESDYRSLSEGRMHACGHDAHTAMLLGAAEVLSRFRDRVPGTVRFVFQPAEEGALPSPVDGVLRSGGADLADSGVLDGADHCFALHVWPDLPIGTVGVSRSYVMAASTHFRVRFRGIPGHHSTPHLAADAITMAAQWILELRTFMSAAINPLEPAVLGFGTLQAGTGVNVIADSAEVTGTFRAFEPGTVEAVTRAMTARAHAVAELYGGSAEVRLRVGTALRNDAGAAALAARAGEAVFGDAGRVVIPESPSLAGEDFALYTKRIPGAMALIGIRNEERGIIHPLHHPLFDLDERVLVYGAMMHVEMVRLFNE